MPMFLAPVGITGPAANGPATIGTNTTTAAGGLWFGTDANLYRSAAATLRADGDVQVRRIGVGAISSVYLNYVGAIHPSTATTLVGFGSEYTAPSTCTGTAFAAALQVRTQASTFTLANLVTVASQAPVVGAGSTVTNVYGVQVDPMTGGTNNYGAAIGAASTQTLWLSNNANNTTAAAGIAFGLSRDTNLYRSAADTLRSDDSLIIGGSSVSFGTYSEGTTTAGTYTGVVSSTPRIMFANGTAVQNWQIDNNSGSMRFILNAAVAGSLTSTGLQVPRIGVGSAPVADYLAFIGGTHPGVTATLYGVVSQVTAPSTATGGLISLYSQGRTAASAFTAGSITSLYAAAPFVGAGSAISTAIGLLVEPTVGATNNYGINLGAASTQTLWISNNADNTTAAAGIAFGASRDTNLYRGAAGQLRTGGSLLVDTTIFALGTITANLSGATEMLIGGVDDGSGPKAGFRVGGDTFLYRKATAVLATQGALAIGVNPALGGGLRLANGQWAMARNVSNTADDYLFGSFSGVLQISNDLNIDLVAGSSIRTIISGAVQSTVTAGLLTMADVVNIAVGTTTGTKIGTSTSQKLAFWGATPIVRPTGAMNIDDVLVATGLRTAGGIASFSDSISVGSNVSTTGSIRLANLASINYRNAANTANLTVLSVDISDRTKVNGLATLRLEVGGAAKLLMDSTTIQVADATNFVLSSTTGTKFGSLASEKIGLWGATPVVQPTTGVGAATFVANTGTAVNDASTFDGYTMKQVVKALRTIGLLA